jgi:DNA repair protein RecO (recombination protein O)
MPFYRDQAIVLRTHKLGESDRIITFLTRENGRVKAVAKGVRKTTSRIGSRLEPFSHVDVHFHIGKSLDIATQIESLFPYGNSFSQDYEKWLAGQILLETAEKLTAEEKEPFSDLFSLLLSALRSLFKSEHEPNLIVDAYLIRAMGLAGYAPSFKDCALCGEPAELNFSIAAGGFTCDSCRPAGYNRLTKAETEHFFALISGDWSQVESSSTKVKKDISMLVSSYVQWHLEKGLKSLRMIER